MISYSYTSMYTKYKYTYMGTILSTIEILLLYHTPINAYEYNFDYINFSSNAFNLFSNSIKDITKSLN